MTNTYPESASPDQKILEEMRCIRCVLERLLRVLDEGMFVDYQMEKFGKMRGGDEPVTCWWCGKVIDYDDEMALDSAGQIVHKRCKDDRKSMPTRITFFHQMGKGLKTQITHIFVDGKWIDRHKVME